MSLALWISFNDKNDCAKCFLQKKETRAILQLLLGLIKNKIKPLTYRSN